MAKATGYTSQYSFQLYDTSGTTEDWNYAAQGSYGYTIEMGPVDGQFHGPYATNVVQQWTGRKGTKTDGKGMREALLLGAEAALDPASHAIVTGTATPGRVLRVHKEFQTLSSPVCAYAQGYLNSGNAVGDQAACLQPGETISTPDKLDYTTVVPASGQFAWHINQSTRPFVGWKYDDKEAGPKGTGKTEAWKLTCESPDGKVLSSTDLVIDRGKSEKVSLPGC
jgi:carboxypeptidase T